jgi:hypothetical protein
METDDDGEYSRMLCCADCGCTVAGYDDEDTEPCPDCGSPSTYITDGDGNIDLPF